MSYKAENKKIPHYKVHMVHLEKLVETGIPQVGKKRADDSDKPEKMEENSFFCYGYYDKMTYIREGEGHFTYEHAFAVKYPYKRAEQSINADQLFTLLEPEPDDSKNPFTAEALGAPFLGVYLITLSFVGGEAEERPELDFNMALGECYALLKQMLNEVCSEGISQIYYSPNCADLCIALRSGCLETFYRVKKELRKYMMDKGYRLGVTLYIASEFERNVKKLSDEGILQKNVKGRIEIRLQCSKRIAGELRSLLNEKEYELYGVTGRGDYTLVLSYQDFAEIYPSYADIKLGKYKRKTETDCEWQKKLIEILCECKFFYEHWYIHEESEGNENNAVNGLEDKNPEKEAWYQDRIAICERMNEEVQKLRDLVNEPFIKDMPKNDNNIAIFPIRRFMEQYHLMKDLLYTYENLWYNERTISEGRVFYAQMAAMLEGIYQQMDVIYEVLCPEIKWCDKAERISASTLNILYNDLISNMNLMISGINNFNKLIQAVNQNLRNVPNYEMQSKVNVEKYLYAYTMYLMDICSKYYRMKIDGEDREKERVFPVVTIAMAGLKINALTLFRKLKDSESKRDGLSVFLVECPNYQRFANVYHVLPMISHEISHCFRYVKREKRNAFIAGFLARRIAEIVTDKLFDMEYQSYRVDKWDKQSEFVCNVIHRELKNYLLQELKEQLPYMHLKNMKNVCIEKMRSFFGVTERYRFSEQKLWVVCKDNFIELFSHCHIVYVTPSIFRENPEVYILDLLPNLLVDIFCGDDGRVKQWTEICNREAMMALGKECCSTATLEYIDFISRAISLYMNDKKISYETVKLGMRMIAKRMWKKFLADNDKADRQGDGDCMKGISDRITGERFELTNKDIETIKEQFKLDEEEIFRLKKYIWETAGLIREIGQQWERYGGECLNGPKKMGDFHVERIHRYLNEEYHDKSTRLIDENPWIVTNRTQRLYTKLGIISENSEQFVSRLNEAVSSIEDGYIARNLDDEMKLYAEVFADLGMCKMFGFTPFGYYAYTIHLFMKERGLSGKSAFDMSEDRIAMVIRTLWEKNSDEKESAEEKQIRFKRESERFKKKIFKYRGIIEKYQEKVQSDKKGSRELEMHRDMLSWMEQLYDTMRLEVMLPDREDLLEHLTEIYCIDEEKEKEGQCMGFLKDSDNLIVSKIGRYYNEFIESVGNEAKEQEIMDVQNAFVLTYYGKMQDACMRVQKVETVQDISFAEQYNRQFMQWQTEEEE